MCYVEILYYANSKLAIGKFAKTLKSFDIELQPFIQEINAKEGVIQEFVNDTTIERIRSMMQHLLLHSIGRNLIQAYRNQRGPSGYYVTAKWFVTFSLHSIFTK